MNFAPLALPIYPESNSLNVHAAKALCPFYDGAETLDLLLGEIRAQEIDLLDATLDLRGVLAAGHDAEQCLGHLFRVRSLLNDRHYLAFYRVRRLISRLIVAQTRLDRTSAWITQEIPPNCARLDELINLCLAPLAEHGEIPSTARIRFAIATSHPERSNSLPVPIGSVR